MSSKGEKKTDDDGGDSTKSIEPNTLDNVFETINQSANFIRESITMKSTANVPYTAPLLQENGTGAILRSARKGPILGFTMDNAWGTSVGMCLVEKGDANQCIFDHAHALKMGKIVPLSLKSHPGFYICRQQYHWIPVNQSQTRGYFYEYVET